MSMREVELFIIEDGMPKITKFSNVLRTVPPTEMVSSLVLMSNCMILVFLKEIVTLKRWYTINYVNYIISLFDVGAEKDEIVSI